MSDVDFFNVLTARVDAAESTKFSKIGDLLYTKWGIITGETDYIFGCIQKAQAKERCLCYKYWSYGVPRRTYLLWVTSNTKTAVF